MHLFLHKYLLSTHYFTVYDDCTVQGLARTGTWSWSWFSR